VSGGVDVLPWCFALFFRPNLLSFTPFCKRSHVSDFSPPVLMFSSDVANSSRFGMILCNFFSGLAGTPQRVSPLRENSGVTPTYPYYRLRPFCVLEAAFFRIGLHVFCDVLISPFFSSRLPPRLSCHSVPSIHFLGLVVFRNCATDLPGSAVLPYFRIGAVFILSPQMIAHSLFSFVIPGSTFYFLVCYPLAGFFSSLECKE